MNYIIALSDLLRYRPREGIEIPIYLADSISVVRKVTPYGEDEFELMTNEGRFWVTKEVIDGKHLYPFLTIMSESLKAGLTKEQFENSLSRDIPLSRLSINSIVRLYEKISKLEEYGKNRIWTSILKNSFSPMLIGKFDYVVGNPPWINWENLPPFYRDLTKDLWDKYGLLARTGSAGMGKVKRDISMLFVARCFEQYVNDDGFGRLGFLIPFTAFKAQAGGGFRNWLAKKCKVERIHDLVELFPFEGAINRTSMIVISHGETQFPVLGKMWSNPEKVTIAMDADLNDVIHATKQYDVHFLPIKKDDLGTQWMVSTKKIKAVVERIIGNSPWYEAHAGIFSGLNAVYWVDILSRQPNGLMIRNTSVSGLKREVQKVVTVIEEDLVYPLIRGREVKRWYVESPFNYHVVPTDKEGIILSSSVLKVTYPKTYMYFMKFFNDLTTRNGEPYKSKLEPYRKKPLTQAEIEAPPFYWLFNAAPSLANYKVVWKAIAGGISGKAVSFASAVVEPTEDKVLGKKKVVLTHSLITISSDNEDEAYYISGVLNSAPVLFVIASYTYEIRMETHITQNVRIDKFDSNNKLHLAISNHSKKAHNLARKYYENDDKSALEELGRVEVEVDNLVAQLYGITEEELEEIKMTLQMLKGQSDKEKIRDEVEEL